MAAQGGKNNDADHYLSNHPLLLHLADGLLTSKDTVDYFGLVLRVPLSKEHSTLLVSGQYEVKVPWRRIRYRR